MCACQLDCQWRTRWMRRACCCPSAPRRCSGAAAGARPRRRRGELPRQWISNCHLAPVPLAPAQVQAQDSLSGGAGRRPFRRCRRAPRWVLSAKTCSTICGRVHAWPAARARSFDRSLCQYALQALSDGSEADAEDDEPSWAQVGTVPGGSGHKGPACAQLLIHDKMHETAYTTPMAPHCTLQA